MDKDTIQYLEGKHQTFVEMYATLQQILTLIKGNIAIIESEELNEKHFDQLVTKAKEFIP